MRAAIVIRLTVVFLLPLLGGCASFRAGHLDPVTEWPPQVDVRDRTPIALRVSGTVDFEGTTRDVPPADLDSWRRQAVKAYEDSGLFSRVGERFGESGLVADVQVTRHTSWPFGPPGAIYGFVIPSSQVEDLTLTTRIRDSHGNTLGSFTASERVTVWYEVFLVFLAPFKNPSAVMGGALYDLNRASIIEAVHAGVFSADLDGEASRPGS